MELKIHSVVYATKNGAVAAYLPFTVRQHNLCKTLSIKHFFTAVYALFDCVLQAIEPWKIFEC